MAICLRHLGSALHQRGDMAEALEHLQLARHRLEQNGGDDKPELIEVKNLMGGILEDQGQTAKALDLFREALRDAERLGLEPARPGPFAPHRIRPRGARRAEPGGADLLAGH